MKVVSRRTPGEDSPTVEVPDISKDLCELMRFVFVIEDELAARYAAIDVIRRTGDEKARVSRHGSSPMRG